MIEGRIIQGIGGFYTVVCDGVDHVCRARGNFRAKNIVPMVGDYVQINPPTDESGGYITKIINRKNNLTRPMVANIDMLVVIVAAQSPNPDLTLVDTLLINADMMDIDVCLVVNKSDLDAQSAQQLLDIYPHIEHRYVVSAVDNSDLTDISNLLRAKTFCFAGQSGVGKSSILNVLMPEANLKVGDISKKTERGKHTTRQANLIPYQDGYLVDSPGFSMLELALMDPVTIKDYYPDFVAISNGCKFATCTHNNSNNCAVVEAVDQNEIDKDRYQRYLRIYNEMVERWKRRYD